MEELSGFQVHTNIMLWIFCADFPKLRFEGKTDKQANKQTTTTKTKASKNKQQVTS